MNINLLSWLIVYLNRNRLEVRAPYLFESFNLNLTLARLNDVRWIQMNWCVLCK